MKKYTFILKPVFFVFNLIFATWLVFQIEKISPSDFGRYKYLFEDPPPPPPVKPFQKGDLVKICSDYKRGKIDSLELEMKLEKLVGLQNKAPSKK